MWDEHELHVSAVGEGEEELVCATLRDRGRSARRVPQRSQALHKRLVRRLRQCLGTLGSERVKALAEELPHELGTARAA